MPFQRAAAVAWPGVIGLTSGVVGAGGAFLLVPVLIAVLRVPVRVSIGTSLAMTGASALMGFLGKAITGQVPVGPALAVIAGSLTGRAAGRRGEPPRPHRRAPRRAGGRSSPWCPSACGRTCSAVEMTPGDAPLAFRRAREADVPEIVRMLADDPLGATRERCTTPLPEAYAHAFRAIEGDPNNELVVAEQGGCVVGVLQLTFIPSLTYQGGWRALVEGVRVDARLRSQGLGKALFEWAIGRARERGCRLVQLTTDKSRPDARRFYESLGFVASHEGMKLSLTPR